MRTNPRETRGHLIGLNWSATPHRCIGSGTSLMTQRWSPRSGLPPMGAGQLGKTVGALALCHRARTEPAINFRTRSFSRSGWSSAESTMMSWQAASTRPAPECNFTDPYLRARIQSAPLRTRPAESWRGIRTERSPTFRCFWKTSFRGVHFQSRPECVLKTRSHPSERR
jgi:hypothetical protein